MAKVQFSDVTPPEKRSIRNIPIPKGGKRKPALIIKPEVEVKNNTKEKEAPFVPPEPPQKSIETENDNISLKISDLTETRQEGPYEYYYPKTQPKAQEKPVVQSKKRSGAKFLFLTIAVLAVGAFIVSMMTIFASATVVVKPKGQVLDVNAAVTASVDGGEGLVKYEVIKLSKSETESVPATKEESVEEKARGKIIVYNNFSPEPQRLIVRTRFESPEGLIYRIPESVTVPGKTVKNGVETPGSVEVEVFADEAGEKYNIKKTDFTVPGFKNDAERYKSFYARSSTDMEGGFIGKRKVVEDKEREATNSRLDEKLKSDLEKEMRAKAPQGLALLNNSINFEFSDLPQKDDSSNAILGREATAYAVFLDKETLSQRLVSEYISGYTEWSGIDAAIKDFSGLSMSGIPATIEPGQKLEMEVSGNTMLVAQIDTDSLKSGLAGVERGNVESVIRGFDGISQMTTTVRPIWKRSFPNDPSKIKVEIEGN